MNDALPPGIEVVAVCVPDHFGRLIGKRVTADRWPAVREHGLPMPNFHLVTGLDNVPYPDLAVTGYHTGFRNGLLMPCADATFRLANEPETLFALSDSLDFHGGMVAEAPRRILDVQVARLAERGIRARFAAELEFYLFRTTYERAARRGYRRLEPYYHLHADNDILLSGYAEGFLSSVRAAMREAGIGCDNTQGEGGEGQYEINIPPAAPLAMADRTVVFKHLVKALAHEQRLAATFMAKWGTGRVGSGGHVHVSLTDEDGKALLEGLEDVPAGRGAAFLAGLLEYAADFCLLHAPFANSYRRLQPDTFAPSNASWGADNRSVLVRTVGGRGAARLEFRLPGADANPYLSFAALLAAGIEGVDRGLAMPAPTRGNAYESDAPAIPGDLTEAVQAFERSGVAGSAFGPAVHRHLLDHGRRERDATRRAVSDWELVRGFERA